MRQPLLFLPCLTLLLTGCAGTLANRLGATSGSTVLSGSNAAIGGVNYAATGGKKDPVWDRHVTACRQNADRGYTFSGDGADLLSYMPDGAGPRVALRISGAPVTFSAANCSVLKLSLTQPGDTSSGRLAVVCDAASHQLNASIRFERCGG